MRLAITGVGLAAAGIDLEQLKKNVVNRTIIQSLPEKTETAELNNYFSPRKLRRVDHFTRMTMLAACRAMQDHADISQDDFKTQLPIPDDMGIIIGSGYGPSETVFDFLDSIIEHGAECASPLSFSHSVHNIPAATISLFLNYQCPCTTICQTYAPLTTALNNAACWITEGRSKNILLGLVDEKTPLLEHNTKRMLDKKASNTDIPLGEGACFFMLSDASESESAKYGSLEFKTIRQNDLADMCKDSAIFAPKRTIARLKKINVSAEASLSADMPTAAAIELAAAVLYNHENRPSVCIEQAGKKFTHICFHNNRR
ncbi:beta-ketoacyl synthase chain length factor [Maridesulfovibrio zosterae]|uniref:beta-ketoacyl synthase chain length factor n=1 Tax=Maridesulfovibrio zosterae TaxID=82171 RepID=UPI00041D925F|nr:beta-ketoacyl synthase chain length factor [Maridesulfovibrio zosterae]